MAAGELSEQFRRASGARPPRGQAGRYRAGLTARWYGSPLSDDPPNGMAASQAAMAARRCCHQTVTVPHGHLHIPLPGWFQYRLTTGGRPVTAVTQPVSGPVSVPVIEVYLTDRLDLASLAPVRVALDAAVRLRPDRLVLDMTRCAAIDAAGVALLLDVHRQLLRVGAGLTLRAPTPRLRRILGIARVERVLHVIPEEAPGSRPESAPIRSGP